mgnify:CR=1 FL=1
MRNRATAQLKPNRFACVTFIFVQFFVLELLYWVLVMLASVHGGGRGGALHNVPLHKALCGVPFAEYTLSYMRCIRYDAKLVSYIRYAEYVYEKAVYGSLFGYHHTYANGAYSTDQKITLPSA